MPPKKHTTVDSKSWKEYSINTAITKELWFTSQNGQDILPAAADTNGFWSLPGFLFSGYQGLFLSGKSTSVKVTTHLHIVLRLRMGAAIPPLSICLHDMHRDNYTFNIKIMNLLSCMSNTWLQVKEPFTLYM